MGITVGPARWWVRTPEAMRPLIVRCPLGTTLPDGSRIFCKAGGTAWIVAPNTTQVSMQWAGGLYNGIDAPGTCRCSISEWSTLQTCLISRGFNPADWFVPNISQLQSGYACRFYWDSVSATFYWSSTEASATNGCGVGFNIGDTGNFSKTGANCVRAFRCVTY